jgi:hypothetical protein
MGIRVHKAIGYGLLDLNPDGDPRFDVTAYYKRSNSEAAEVFEQDYKGFLAWLEVNGKRVEEVIVADRPYAKGHTRTDVFLVEEGIKDAIKRKDYWSPGSSVCYSDEGGLKNVLCIVPPEYFREWHRHDDTLDWTEESVMHGQRSRVETVPMGIFPFSGTLVRVRPPKNPALWDEGRKFIHQSKHFDEHGPTILNGGEFNLLVGGWDPKMKPQAEPDLLEHLHADWRPMIPAGVLAMLIWLDDLGVLPNGVKAVTDDMRAMLYVYWC